MRICTTHMCLYVKCVYLLRRTVSSKVSCDKAVHDGPWLMSCDIIMSWLFKLSVSALINCLFVPFIGGYNGSTKEVLATTSVFFSLFTHMEITPLHLCLLLLLCITELYVLHILSEPVLSVIVAIFYVPAHGRYN